MFTRTQIGRYLHPVQFTTHPHAIFSKIHGYMSYDLRLGLVNVLFPLGFPANIL
jgi:hypothetical protein